MTRHAVLLALLAACVPEPTFRGIGPGVDAMPDAPFGNVSVRTYSRDLLHNLQQGVTVYFVDRNGTVRTEATTGGSAEVSGEIEQGGTLFVHYPLALVIIADVRLGQTYELGAAQAQFATRALATANVARVGTAPNYRVFAPCGDGSVTDGTITTPVAVPFTWRDGCGATNPVGVMSYHSNAVGAVISTRYQPITNGATAPAFLMNATPSPPVTITVNVTGNNDLKSVTPSVSAVEGTTRYGGTVFMPITSDMLMSTGSYFRASATSELSAQYTLNLPSPEYGPQVLLDRVPNQVALTRDVRDAVRAPFLSAPIPDADLTTFRWAQTDGAAQFVALDLSITRGDGVVRSVRYFFPPGNMSQTTLPAMPEPIAEFTPVADDTVAAMLSMTRMDGAEFADIAAVYDVYVSAVEGQPTRLLDASTLTSATISKSP